MLCPLTRLPPRRERRTCLTTPDSGALRLDDDLAINETVESGVVLLALRLSEQVVQDQRHDRPQGRPIRRQQGHRRRVLGARRRHRSHRRVGLTSCERPGSPATQPSSCSVSPLGPSSAADDSLVTSQQPPRCHGAQAVGRTPQSPAEGRCCRSTGWAGLRDGDGAHSAGNARKLGAARATGYALVPPGARLLTCLSPGEERA